MGQTYVFIGMPGSGKTTIGRRLAARLGLPFADSDVEIEVASGLSVAEIFARFGEPEFRIRERKMIESLITGEQKIISTGGGAFMNDQTRALIKDRALSIWLNPPLPVVLARCLRHGDRPLLKKGDPAEILQNLRATRGPVYAEADLMIETDDRPVEATVTRVLDMIRAHEKAKDPCA